MWGFFKYLFYVNYCVEQKKWKNKNTAAVSAATWIAVVIVFNLGALSALVEVITGIPFFTRAMALPNKTWWILLLPPFLVFIMYFGLPGTAESISREFSQSGIEPPQIKMHNLYIWIELFVAVLVLAACVVINRAYNR